MGDEGNRFLDRASLVGMHEDPLMGFFTDIIDGVMSGEILK
jgi:hypothetical protein